MRRLEVGGAPTSLAQAKALAVGSRDTMTFQVGTMALPFFLNKANKEGGSLAF